MQLNMLYSYTKIENKRARRLFETAGFEEDSSSADSGIIHFILGTGTK